MEKHRKKTPTKQNQELYEVIICKDFKLRGFQATQSSSLPRVCPLECILIAPSYQSQTSQHSNRIKAGFYHILSILRNYCSKVIWSFKVAA